MKYDREQVSILLKEIDAFLKTNQFLDLTGDLVFKAFFEGDGQLTLVISLLNCSLPLPAGSTVIKVIILNPEIYPEKLKSGRFDNKLGKTFILDIKIELQRLVNRDVYQEVCNVEMQTTETPRLIDRIIAYTGRLLSKLLGKGDNFDKLTTVYSLLFTTKNLRTFKNIEDYYHVAQLIRKGSPSVVLSDILTFTVVELGKFDKKLEELDNERDCWFYLIKHSKALDTEACRILIKKGGYIMAESVSRLFEISKDSLLQEYEEARAKQQFDQSSREHEARKEGIEKGRMEGMEKGIEKSQKEIALNLLEMKMSVSQVIEATGLSEKQVLEIQKKTDH